ncbi:MAG: transglutaminase domain-containing protein [Acutalibacteraceae bacterium]
MRKFIVRTVSMGLAILIIFAVNISVNLHGIKCADITLHVNAYDDENTEIEEILKQRIVDAIDNLQDTIYILDLGISKYYDFDRIFFQILDEHPEFFYLSTYYYASWSGSTFTHFSVSFTYEDIEEISEKKAVFDETCDKILSKVDPSWSDYEKALYMHDYIVLNAEYNSNYDEWDSDTEDYNAYGILVNGMGICSGYACAYAHLLNLVGIENKFAESDDMDHIWNLVKIDGEYYHADLTFDDTEYNNIGRVKHSNFLLSDSAIENASGTKHTGWQEYTDIVAESTRFDDYFWRDIESGFFSIDGLWYFVDKKGDIKSYDFTSESENLVLSVDTTWKKWGTTNVLLNDKYVRILEYSDKILYNTDSEVFITDVNEVAPEKIFEADTSTGYIYGIGIKEDKLTYCLKTRSGDKENSIETDLDIQQFIQSNETESTKPKIRVIVQDALGNNVSEKTVEQGTEIVLDPPEDYHEKVFVEWRCTLASESEMYFTPIYKNIGDVDKNDILNLQDVYLIYLYTLSRTETANSTGLKNIDSTTFKLCNINNDNVIDILDCNALQERLLSIS